MSTEAQVFVSKESKVGRAMSCANGEHLEPKSVIIEDDPFDTPTKCPGDSSVDRIETPQLPSAPHSSPVNFSEQVLNSKMSTSFKSKFLKACMAKLPQIRMSKSSVGGEFNPPHHSSPVNLSVFHEPCTKIDERLNLGYCATESITDKVKYSSLLSVASTISESDIDLSRRSPCSDKVSMVALCASDASNLSADSLSEDEIFNRLSMESISGADFDILVKSYDLKAQKTPRSSLRSVLNWKRCAEVCKRRASSVDDIRDSTSRSGIKFPRTQFELSV